jgi:hypothetical protein
MLQCDSFSTTDRIAVLTIAENPVVLSIYQRGKKAKNLLNQGSQTVHNPTTVPSCLPKTLSSESTVLNEL